MILGPLNHFGQEPPDFSYLLFIIQGVTRPNVSIVSIILLFGIAQGIFLAVLLFHKHSSIRANRFLGTMMAVFVIILFHVFFGEVGFYRSYPRLMLLLMSSIFLWGPYTFSMLDI